MRVQSTSRAGDGSLAPRRRSRAILIVQSERATLLLLMGMVEQLRWRCGEARMSKQDHRLPLGSRVPGGWVWPRTLHRSPSMFGRGETAAQRK
ncbi:hypothetical protein CERZMDRAFT_109926 [Cercospora zeae-maydis SCOH1-5]|uniref:Uncharacterized protein n=1 Tax=Cercospora zeae-maydis SCOH1-5 TaxID=717836 RepID=A0A6A6FNZ4_9PEZI|nr:hypothetical protein CERZMDRAFT_109926 [Cercospora zeae-maydis SCOH1-5]